MTAYDAWLHLLAAAPWLPALAAVTVVVLAWVGLLARRLRRLERRLELVLSGPVEAAAGGDAALRARLHRLEARLDECLARLEGSLQRVGLVRFDAFPDVGGQQSFAVALLDDRGDGILLSSLFGREQSWTYAKPVRGGSSPYPLSPEEREAIARALAVRGAASVPPPGAAG